MLKWTFGADTKPFQAGLAQMRSQTQAFSGNVSGMLAGAFGVGAIIGGLRSMFVEMDRVAKLGARFGESTDTIQRVAHAADLAGADLETMARSVGFVTKNAIAAATGNSELAKEFERLGINAATFADLPMDQKMVLLSRGLQTAGSSAEGMTAIMKVMGKAGVEMLPLLAQGPEALAKSMADAQVVGESAVRSIEAFNDSLTTGKNVVQSWAGYFIQQIQTLAVIWTAVLTVMATVFTESFQEIMSQSQTAMSAVGKSLSGDFAGAAAKIDEFSKRTGQGFRRIKESAKSNATAAILQIMGIWSAASTPKKGGTGEVDTDGMRERKKLADDIAKLEEESRQRQLSLAEKILKAQQAIADLANESSYAGTEEERLEARKKMLQVEADLAGLRDEQKSDDEKTRKELESEEKRKQDGIKDAEKDEAKLARDQKFGKLDDAGKVAMLEEEKKAALELSRALEDGNNMEGSIRARIEAMQAQGDIDDIKGKKDESKTATPTIAAEDLRRAGGGGFARLTTSDPQREALTRFDTMILELREINRKTNGGESAVPPPF